MRIGALAKTNTIRVVIALAAFTLIGAMLPSIASAEPEKYVLKESSDGFSSPLVLAGFSDDLTSIQFYPNGASPEVDLSGITPVSLDKQSLGTIKGYFDTGTGAVYVLSEGIIMMPENSTSWFRALPGVTKINTEVLDTSAVTNMQALFFDCAAPSLDLSTWDTSSVTNMQALFYECAARSLDLSDWDTSSVVDMSLMFSTTSAASLDVSGWDTSSVNDMSIMFAGSAFETLDLSHWDTSQVNNMDDMFTSASKLKALSVIGWDVSSVGKMENMFGYCSSLTSLNLSTWDTSSVVSMANMFEDCSSLASLDVSGWDTSSVEDMTYMFAGCTALASLDVSAWNTANVATMAHMFADCVSLVSLDLSSFNTFNTTSMWRMFNGCTKLQTLNLSSFDTSGITAAEGLSEMFSGANKIASLTLGANFSFDGASASRFDVALYTPSGLSPNGSVYTGLWSDLKGNAYVANEIPNNIAATYVPQATHVVAFDSVGGSAVPNQAISTGNKVVEPSAPTKDGFVFNGWLNDGVKYDFNQPVATDLVLTADWISSATSNPGTGDALPKTGDTGIGGVYAAAMLALMGSMGLLFARKVKQP